MYTITLAIRSTDPAPPRPKYETDDALEAYNIAERYCESIYAKFRSWTGRERWINPDVPQRLQVLWQELDNGELTEWHYGPVSVVCE